MVEGTNQMPNHTIGLFRFVSKLFGTVVYKPVNLRF